MAIARGTYSIPALNEPDMDNFFSAVSQTTLPSIERKINTLRSVLWKPLGAVIDATSIISLQAIVKKKYHPHPQCFKHMS